MAIPDEYVVIPPAELDNYTGKAKISSHCVIFARLPGVIRLGTNNYPAHGAVMVCKCSFSFPQMNC